MKIVCECGSVIVEQTDYLSNKAYVISDQDWFDLLDAIDEAISERQFSEADREIARRTVRGLAIRLAGTAYQCPACGAVHITNRQGGFERFDRPAEFETVGIFASALGENWRRPLTGAFDDSRIGAVKGYLWKDVVEKATTFSTLEESYYQAFN